MLVHRPVLHVTMGMSLVQLHPLVPYALLENEQVEQIAQLVTIVQQGCIKTRRVITEVRAKLAAVVDMPQLVLLHAPIAMLGNFLVMAHPVVQIVQQAHFPMQVYGNVRLVSLVNTVASAWLSVKP